MGLALVCHAAVAAMREKSGEEVWLWERRVHFLCCLR